MTCIPLRARHRVRMMALLGVLAVAMGVLTPLPRAVPGAYVVDAGALLPAGARVLRVLPVADAILVSSPVAMPDAAPADAPLHPEALVVTATPGGEVAIDTGVAATGAPHVWATTRGEQAVVALIDTGVAPVAALEGAVAGEIDFTGTGGGDGHGHGTFLASLIAGRGPTAPGVAPGAGVLSLKVAGPDGATTLDSVLAALQWLHGPGRAAGIGVATLAMGVEPGSEAARVLDRAVTKLAKAGVLVVTAAGNDGPGNLTSPATAPGSFSVGAVDDGGTAARTDDTVAPFSGTGVDAAGAAQPDALASGHAILGSLPAGSVVAAGTSRTPEGLYRGSGTSMAAALTAGVAALAVSARPDLDGAALDAALRAGGGPIDAEATLAAALQAPRGHGNGRSAAALGPHRGEVDPQSMRWTSVRWTSVRWTGHGWADAGWPLGIQSPGIQSPGRGDTGIEGSPRWTGRAWQVDPQSVRWTSVRWTSVRWTWLR